MYLFRSLSFKLLHRCGLLLPTDSGQKLRWHDELPADVVVSFATPPISIPAEFIDVLVQLQQTYVSDGTTAAYIHVPYFDMIPGTESRLNLSSDLFSFLRARVASKAPALPWWSFRAHIKRALSTLDHNHSLDVQPGAGLMQFSSSSLLNISVPCLIKALGNNYMSSIVGFIRRWRTGLASVGPSNFGHHVVVPFWGSEDWVCSGCSRHANFTRDPLWATKPCPSPYDARSLDCTLARNLLDVLILLEQRVRFHEFPFALTATGLPNTEEIISHLQEQFDNLDRASFASLLSLDPSSAKLPVKLKECKLPWKAVADAWGCNGHLFLLFAVQ